MKISKLLFGLAKTELGDFIVGITFGKFSALLPVKRVIENDKVLAFWHPKPFWENHILIVPKKSIESLTNVQQEDGEYILAMFTAVKDIVKKLNWEKASYSILINGGSRQEVKQLHMHLFMGDEVT